MRRIGATHENRELGAKLYGTIGWSRSRNACSTAPSVCQRAGRRPHFIHDSVQPDVVPAGLSKRPSR